MEAMLTTTAEETEAQPRTFDRALADLEDCVRQLEAGGLNLADAVAAFERGVSLQMECQELLDATQRRIEELSPSSPTNA
jgi:exodeoxyribonuclease VII small subunit